MAGDSLTCVTGTRLWGVASIEGRRPLFTAIRRRRRWQLAVLVCPQYSTSSFRSIFILEVFLQPGGNDALYCVCHSTDEAWLLLIKTWEKERKVWTEGWYNMREAETNAYKQRAIDSTIICSLLIRKIPWQASLDKIQCMENNAAYKTVLLDDSDLFLYYHWGK